MSSSKIVKAACVIIGDEVLNGKITDTNSKFFSKYCYELGIKLTEICIIGDEPEHLISTCKRLAITNDLIVTTGSTGPTPDDIAYDCLCKVYDDTPLCLSKTCVDRMERFNAPTKRLSGQALKDHYRMATLPSGLNTSEDYPLETSWVPVAGIHNQIFIFPGIPQLFENLINNMKDKFKQMFQLKDIKYKRYYIKTEYGESSMSRILRDLQNKSNKTSPEIKIGSYPHWGLGFNTISVLGFEEHDDLLKELRDEVIQKLEGTEISAEEEEKISEQRVEKETDDGYKVVKDSA
ncbi:Molybdopterin binding protein [Hanseniaspora valbyensis NRRL Y-1626]|uniref:Molybdopterin binding protein n=1 Tax=Hanseniaspora valbyensis NRRL Y-1626 TaxID=766949 RepID=A0A1B7TAA6_9ASCO|nr:Molybdopterin binding protein [Hanseniaspora valbyensis NRRL Y-1626]